jgi:hypothetical protein
MLHPPFQCSFLAEVAETKVLESRILLLGTASILHPATR